MNPPTDLASPGRPKRLKGPLTAWANVIVVAWLGIAVLVLVVHDVLGLPRWLALHAFLLGAVTNAIIIWSEHFVVALCHVPPPSEQRMARGLAVLNTSVVLVLLGVWLEAHWLSGTGALGVSVLASVHTWHLLRIRRDAPAGQFAHLFAYYAAASLALAVGGVLGGSLTAGGLGWYGRLWAAHVHATLLGWLGLSVLGTLTALWPVALRTRIPGHALPTARRSLPLYVTGLAATVTGFTVASTLLAVAGLIGYAVGVTVALAPFAAGLRHRAPHRPAPWMLAAATCWLAVGILAEAGWLLAGGEVSTVVDRLLAVLVVGFGAQILVGALTQLLPAVLGRGPAEHKRIAAVLDRAWPARLIGTNLAVPLVSLDLPEPLPLVGWGLAVAGVGAFVVLALSAAVPVAVRGVLPPARAGSGVLPGLVVGRAVTLAAVGVAVSGGPAPAPAAGPERTVDVELASMRVTPSVLTVPAGTRLRLRVTNTDPMPHDLRLTTGAATSRLGTGDTEVLDAGVVHGDIAGWCTVAGHKAAGMTLSIRPEGHPSGAGTDGRPDGTDLIGPPRDATLPPAPTDAVHRIELRVTEQEMEVAPGQREPRWTFGGTVPGPTVRGEIGDRFEITLVNDGTLGHSIDFHAGALAPDQPMRTIAPGERLVYTFTAQRAGAWLYHCSTMPMSLHIANGMYGAVVIDPPELAPVAREYLLVGGELYRGDPGSDPQLAKIRDGGPDGWLFNGTAAQYDHAPLPARVGERVRFWVVNAGPGGTMSFHVVGGQFDTVYKEGAWLLRPGAGGAQALDLATAQGGFVELAFPEPGRYPFVDHDMRHAEGGAHGIIEVTP